MKEIYGTPIPCPSPSPGTDIQDKGKGASPDSSFILQSVLALADFGEFVDEELTLVGAEFVGLYVVL